MELRVRAPGVEEGLVEGYLRHEDATVPHRHCGGWDDTEARCATLHRLPLGLALLGARPLVPEPEWNPGSTYTTSPSCRVTGSPLQLPVM